MKTIAIYAFLIFPALAWASGPVVVTLSKPANAADAERGVIEVTMRNDGDTPVYLFTAAMVEHALIANVFCIHDASGNIATHHVNPGKFISSKDAFYPIPAHGERHATVDLDIVYELAGGMNDITYGPEDYYDRPQDDQGPHDAPAGRTIGNTMTTWINTSLLRTTHGSSWGPQISEYRPCKPGRQAP